MPYYALTNTPTVPVSLSDAKSFLRVDFTKDDSLITSLISSAVEWGERFTNSNFSQHDWEGFYEDVCFTNHEIYGFLPLERSPITAVTSVEVSTSGIFSAITDFIRKQRNSYDRILITQTQDIDDTVAYTYKVTFSSGYATLPDAIKTAILEHVAFLYENRADAPSDPPNQIKELYRPFRHVAGYA